jgi:uncharacterized protein
VRVERISPGTERAVLEYLARSPYENVFVTHLVLHDFSHLTRDKIFVAFDGDRVRGAAYMGRQLALACDDAAIEALATHAQRHRGERMILGRKESVEQYWEHVRSWHAPARLVRERQLVMALDRSTLKKRAASDIVARHAQPDEWRAVGDSSAQMIEQELKYDPRRASRDFASNVRRMIEADLWWVAPSGGRLVFFCNIGPWCTRTAQLQGIWTPPESRRRGHAAAALASMCDQLLDVIPTLSLYVNDFNDAAIALYRGIGFEHVSDFQTMLF